MLANFKKIGVAAAVVTAIGASGAAQAVTLGHPGDALLVPFVYGNRAEGTNTLIGITVASPSNVNVGQFSDLSPAAPTHPAAGTLTPTKTTAGCNDKGTLHWYFFDQESVEVVDDTIPVTCEDFVRFDWNYIIEKKALPSADGLVGYLVITDNKATETTASSLILYATAYLIQNNWASQAFIPALPLVDSVDGTAGDEVAHSGGSFVANVNPVTAGMLLPSARTDDTAYFSLRYFLDPALGGNTRFVLWFPDNNFSQRNNQSVIVYDADERGISARTSIPYELNVLDVSPTATTGGAITGVIRDGLLHENTDGAGNNAVGNAVNTGFVLFNVRDYDEDVSSVTPVEGSRAGFAFSLIGVQGSSTSQVQTELAHERGLR